MPAKFITLKKRTSFQRAAKFGRRFVFPTFILQTTPLFQLKETVPLLEPQIAVGFTASKKVGNAVKRNYAKRRLRAALQQQLAHLQPSPFIAYIFIARTAILTADFTEVLADMLTALERAQEAAQ